MYTLAVMATAGLYDDSGHLALPFRPACKKAGWGGGLLAVCPGKFGIAVVSPPLDQARQQRKKPRRPSTTSSKKLKADLYLVQPR